MKRATLLLWVLLGAALPGLLRAQTDPAETCYRAALTDSREASRCDLAVRVALDANDRRAAAAAYANRALILEADGRPELAGQDLLAALDLTPNDADLLAIRGAYLLRAGRPREAAESFDRAASLRPDDPVTHYNRAFALRALGDARGAAAAVARARELRDAPLRPEGSGAQRVGRAP